MKRFCSRWKKEKTSTNLFHSECKKVISKWKMHKYVSYWSHGRRTFQIVFFFFSDRNRLLMVLLSRLQFIRFTRFACFHYVIFLELKSSNCIENRCAMQSIFRTFGFCDQHSFQSKTSGLGLCMGIGSNAHALPFAFPPPLENFCVHRC